MSNLVAVALIAAFLAWLLGAGKRKPMPAPEDDVETPIDETELEAAEREMRSDASARPINEAMKDEEGGDDDDWGPGTSRSNLPGIV